MYKEENIKEENTKDINKGKLWNKYLGIISIINVTVITIYYFLNLKTNSFHKQLIYLIMIYTYVCAIRGIFPRVENSRLCAFNNTLSSPFLGRSIATVAELSFAYYLVSITKKLLTDFYNSHGKLITINYLLKTNNILFSLIIVAQVVCWVGIITTDPSWNVMEESLWSIFGMLKVTIYSILFINILNVNNPSSKIQSLRNVIPFIIIGFMIYILFMLTIDVPMYIKKAKEQKRNNLSLIDGVTDLLKCKKISLSYKIWKNEIPWLTLYFTVTIWFSFGLMVWLKYKKLI
jgi:hypothetical protein